LDGGEGTVQRKRARLVLGIGESERKWWIYESQGHRYDLEFVLGALWQFLVREIPHVMKFVPQILAFSNGYHTDTN
jgi:hypothetical protein